MKTNEEKELQRNQKALFGGRVFDPPPFCFRVATTLGKLFTHVCLCHQAVNLVRGQVAVIPCRWEGNRMSDVALAGCGGRQTRVGPGTIHQMTGQDPQALWVGVRPIKTL